MFKKTISLFAIFLGLAGCADIGSSPFFTPQHVGISPTHWNQLSTEQKQKILADVGQIQGPQTLIRNTSNKASAGTQLAIKLQGGTAKMPPFEQRYPYQPVTLSLNDNSCHTVSLQQQGGNHQISLQLCYINNVLYLDPSRYDLSMQYGLQLPALPVWRRGYRYSDLSSQGYAGLLNINLIVKKVNESQ